MIESFKDFDNRYKHSRWMFRANRLSVEETEALRSELKLWGDSQFKPADDVLADYYNLIIPRQLLLNTLNKNLDLAYEVYSEGISDTCQRDLLIDSVLEQIGLRHWPMNGDSQETQKSFFESLRIKLAEVGGKMVT